MAKNKNLNDFKVTLFFLLNQIRDKYVPSLSLKFIVAEDIASKVDLQQQPLLFQICHFDHIVARLSKTITHCLLCDLLMDQ
jgi:hypothetical protein